MSLLELSDLLRQLIMEHDSVSLPGMGCFTVVETPSELLNEGRMITPPLKKIVFDSSDSIQDNLLVQQYARLKNISEKDAAGEVADLLRQMKKELVDNAKVVIPDFGALCFGASGSFVFEASAEFDFESDSYCLETLLLQKRSEIGDIEVVDVEVAEEGRMEQEIEMMEKDEAMEKVESVDLIEPIDTVEPIVQGEQMELDIVEECIQEKTEIDRVEESAGIDKIEERNEIDKAEETERPEEPEKAGKIWQTKETEDIEGSTKEVMQRTKNGGAGRLLMWFGIIVGLLILLVIVVLLFKDALMPVLEQLLYSEEELEILKLSKPSL